MNEPVVIREWAWCRACSGFRWWRVDRKLWWTCSRGHFGGWTGYTPPDDERYSSVRG